MVRRPAALAALALGALAACSGDQPVPLDPSTLGPSATVSADASYIVLGAAGRLPDGIAARIAAAGGTVTATIPEIGIAVATTTNPEFATAAAQIAGVSGVVVDPMVEWVKPQPELEALADDGTPQVEEAASVNPSNDTYYGLQWSHDAVDSPAAWAAGATGQGVRIAVLDGGIYAAHADLNDNVDVGASWSFVPGQPYNFDTGTFWHGTHVAGIIAAEDNNIGVVGIAPKATLIGVKVLHGGTGAFSWMLEGIVYAAKSQSAGGAGANIINLSLGAGFFRAAQENAQLAAAINRATSYATAQGTTVIAAAGNSGIDLDHTANYVFFPAQAANVITIAASAPLGWATAPSTASLDNPASYTNFGVSAIDFAAPGGDAALPGSAVCTVAPVTNFCWVFDLVLSTSRGSSANGAYSWAAGTSMASPAAAGVAALIIEKNGGSLSPALVGAALRRTADDLGKPGDDVYYGAGRVNAARAVGAN